VGQAGQVPLQKVQGDLEQKAQDLQASEDRQTKVLIDSKRT
jgi:hypothetical protein